jgi:hypothetical protein
MRNNLPFPAPILVFTATLPACAVLVPAGWLPYQDTSDPEQWRYVDALMIDKYEITDHFHCQFLNNGSSISNRTSEQTEATGRHRHE